MKQSYFSHLLVPHDGTEISDIALDEATRFAKMFNSELTSLFVVEEQTVSSCLLLSFIKSGSDVEQSKKNIRNLLKAGAKALLKDRSEKLVAKNISFNLQIGIGSPSKEILDYTKKEDIDTVVTGRKQIPRFGSINAIGSIARKVSENCSCNVLLVH